MSASPLKYADIIEWVTNALDGIGGNNGKLVLNVSGGRVDADLETTNVELDTRGRRVKVKRIATTQLKLDLNMSMACSTRAR